MAARLPTVKLHYSIHGSSGFSGKYRPENILVDRPTDQTSRWSSDGNSPPQFLLLKLHSPAVVKMIKFGKFEKIHACNLKKFKILGGLTEDGLVELLDAGLRNDSVAEMLSLRHTVDKRPFPCNFIKIVPLQSWGPNFYFSVWFVELYGLSDPIAVQPCLNWYNSYREKEALRLCLKHLRHHNFMDIFEELQKRSRVELESPLLSDLHQRLVVDGDYKSAEKLCESAARDGLFTEYLSKLPCSPEWSLIESDSSASPGMRGGHQMVIDPNSEMIFLHGGWNGQMDVADFWAFSIVKQQWQCLSENTAAEGGPGPRSCHKMVIDCNAQRIFTLGRYVELSSRTDEQLKSDFYVYDIQANSWLLISEDTAAVGGPQLIFDHQMAIDQENQVIYCFGGKIISKMDGCEGVVSFDRQFSGLYSYNIPTNCWTLLRQDCNELQPGAKEIRSRMGHSMLFYPHSKSLYIFAGQRAKEQLGDMFVYYIDSDEIEMLSDYNIPAAGLTQRATIDVETGEIFALSGISRDKEKKLLPEDNNSKNSLWIYQIAQHKWTCVYSNSERSPSAFDTPANKFEYFGQFRPNTIEPCPRFAHQLVFDPIRKIHFLFGGNPGRQTKDADEPPVRLDDFWALKLHRQDVQQLFHRFRFLIRQYSYRELVGTDPIAALNCLQTEVFDSVDHCDPGEQREFQDLTLCLFQPPTSAVVNDETHRLRIELFEYLTTFFPETMTPPKANLVDLVQI